MCGRPQVRDIKFTEVPDAQAGSLWTDIGILDHAEQQISLDIVDSSSKESSHNAGEPILSTLVLVNHDMMLISEASII
jgi:hypothetical protein